MLIQFGEFRLDRHRFLLYRNADVIKLRTKPCEVLAYLVTNHGRVVPKAELLEAVWKKPDADPNLVEQSIRQIRAVLEADPKVPAWVVTIPGGGYRYLGPKAVPLSDASSLDSGSNGPLPTGSQNAASNSSTQDITLGEDPSASIASRGPKSKGHPLLNRPFIIRVIAGGLAAVLGIGIILYVTAPGEPAACEVSVNTLIAKDGQGREIWRYEFTEQLNALFYKEHPPLCQFIDLNHDGIADVLFAEKLATSDLTSDTLYGFITGSRLGRRLHPAPTSISTFHPGVDVLVGPTGDPNKRVSEEYLPPWTIVNLFSKNDADGKATIIVSSAMGQAPDQIAVLDGALQKHGEYWHTGVLSYGQFVPYRGHDRIFLGGVNNGYHAATLVTFDPKNVAGTTDLTLDLPDRHPLFGLFAAGSRERLVTLGKGTETCRVIFSRTCIAKAKPKAEPYNRVTGLRVTDDRIFVTVTESEKGDSRVRVVYEMDRHLNLVEAGPTTEFQQRHQELEREGLLDHAYSVEELRPLIHVLPGCEFTEHRD